jgi:hypothetical protein
VIVVENDGNVGLRPRQPVVNVIEALEERLPVGIVLLLSAIALPIAGTCVLPIPPTTTAIVMPPLLEVST